MASRKIQNSLYTSSSRDSRTWTRAWAEPVLQVALVAWIGVELGETWCGRAALLPRCVEGDPGARFGLPPHRGMRHNFSEEQSGSVEGQVLRAYRRDSFGKHRAAVGRRIEVRPVKTLGGHSDGHCAVMGAVAPATCWERALQIGGCGEERKDKWRAECDQQRDGKDPAHGTSIAQ